MRHRFLLVDRRSRLARGRLKLQVKSIHIVSAPKSPEESDQPLSGS